MLMQNSYNDGLVRPKFSYLFVINRQADFQTILKTNLKTHLYFLNFYFIYLFSSIIMFLLPCF